MGARGERACDAEGVSPCNFAAATTLVIMPARLFPAAEFSGGGPHKDRSAKLSRGSFIRSTACAVRSVRGCSSPRCCLAP